MRVLLTNDDGIGASGLQALRRALLEIDGIELRHRPRFQPQRDGALDHDAVAALDRGGQLRRRHGRLRHRRDAVDCVRFADLGLIGERPELIVSGINHGANLGDDVTYSGTVAAALEGIVLGIPAIAVSQQSLPREMGLPARPPLRLLGLGAADRRAGRDRRRRAAAAGRC